MKKNKSNLSTNPKNIIDSYDSNFLNYNDNSRFNSPVFNTTPLSIDHNMQYNGFISPKTPSVYDENKLSFDSGMSNQNINLSMDVNNSELKRKYNPSIDIFSENDDNDIEGIFIDDDYKNIILENDNFGIYNFRLSEDDLINDAGEIDYKKTTKRMFYRLELSMCILYSFIISMNTFLILETVNDIFAKYIIKIFLDNLALLGVLYISTNVCTYRSINISLGYLLINAGIFNYNKLSIFIYFIIGIVGNFIGHIIVSIFYRSFILNLESLSDILNIVSPNFEKLDGDIYLFIIINIIIVFIFISLNVIIINNTASLECKKMVFQKVAVSTLIDIVFKYHTKGVNDTYSFYMFRIILCLFNNTLEPFREDRILIGSISVIIWIIIIPIIVKQFNHKFKSWYSRYIEY